MKDNKHSIHTKIWIEDKQGNTVFGAGQLKILEVIDSEGSISAAAKAMNMGYRSMWGRLKKIEERTGKPVLIRKKGGAAGGNSVLTPEAKVMVEKFKKLKQKIDHNADEVFKDIAF
ncbi:MAG: LysR family transcriptional regulator [Desulfobacteraceae bacterium]|nr:LysR family transcriptional regulator [Desulfobacteraceae bacterium]